METTEALGYLKGLIDGLDLDDNKKETKVIKAIVDVIESMNNDVDDICEELDIVEEQLDEIDDDLSSLEEAVYDDDYCDGCDGCCDFSDDYDDDELETYEISCPACGATLTVDENTIDEGFLNCPVCEERLEFEIEFPDDDEDAE